LISFLSEIDYANIFFICKIKSLKSFSHFCAEHLNISRFDENFHKTRPSDIHCPLTVTADVAADEMKNDYKQINTSLQIRDSQPILRDWYSNEKFILQQNFKPVFEIEAHLNSNIELKFMSIWLTTTI